MCVKPMNYADHLHASFSPRREKLSFGFSRLWKKALGKPLQPTGVSRATLSLLDQDRASPVILSLWEPGYPRAPLIALGGYTWRVKVRLSPWYIIPSLPSCRLYICVIGNWTLKGGILFFYWLLMWKRKWQHFNFHLKSVGLSVKTGFFY